MKPVAIILYEDQRAASNGFMPHALVVSCIADKLGCERSSLVEAASKVCGDTRKIKKSPVQRDLVLKKVAYGAKDRREVLLAEVPSLQRLVDRVGEVVSRAGLHT
jgi:hypothetical protein